MASGATAKGRGDTALLLTCTCGGREYVIGMINAAHVCSCHHVQLTFRACAVQKRDGLGILARLHSQPVPETAFRDISKVWLNLETLSVETQRLATCCEAMVSCILPARCDNHHLSRDCACVAAVHIAQGCCLAVHIVETKLASAPVRHHMLVLLDTVEHKSLF